MEPLVWDGQVQNILCKLKMSPIDEEKQQDSSLIYELELARLGSLGTLFTSGELENFN